MSSENCRGKKNGWPLCPWVLTGSMVKPYYFFQKKMEEAGNQQVADQIGTELAKFMVLLDKLFILEKMEGNGEDIIPGFQAWLTKTMEKWSPDDCFCSEDMRMPPFRAGEKELLTSLWLKSRILHLQ